MLLTILHSSAIVSSTKSIMHFLSCVGSSKCKCYCVINIHILQELLHKSLNNISSPYSINNPFCRVSIFNLSLILLHKFIKVHIISLTFNLLYKFVCCIGIYYFRIFFVLKTFAIKIDPWNYNQTWSKLKLKQSIISIIRSFYVKLDGLRIISPVYNSFYNFYFCLLYVL